MAWADTDKVPRRGGGGNGIDSGTPSLPARYGTARPGPGKDALPTPPPWVPPDPREAHRNRLQPRRGPGGLRDAPWCRAPAAFPLPHHRRAAPAAGFAPGGQLRKQTICSD